MKNRYSFAVVALLSVTAAAPPQTKQQQITASNGVTVAVSDVNANEKEFTSPRVKIRPEAGAEGWVMVGFVASNQGQIFERRVYAHIEYAGEERAYIKAHLWFGVLATVTVSFGPGDRSICKRIQTSVGEKCTEDIRVDLQPGDVGRHMRGNNFPLTFFGKTDGSGHILYVDIPISYFDAVGEVARRGH